MLRARVAFLVFAAALIGQSLTPAENDPGYKLIVNAASPATSVSRDTLVLIFLKKTNAWPSGPDVTPVDQQSDSPARRAFSLNVLGKTPHEVASYWNQMILSGRAFPPPVKRSDHEVLVFVRGDSSAVGYVMGSTEVGQGLRVLKIQADAPAVGDGAERSKSLRP